MIEDDPLSVFRLVRTLISLVLVCSLAAFVILQLAKRGVLTKLQKSDRKNEQKLRVYERLSLDRKNQVVVLGRGGKPELLVSSGDQGVTVLGTVASDGSIVAIPGETRSEVESRFEPRLLNEEILSSAEQVVNLGKKH